MTSVTVSIMQITLKVLSSHLIHETVWPRTVYLLKQLLRVEIFRKVLHMTRRLWRHAWMRLTTIYQRKPFPDTDLSRCGDWGENDIGALFLHFKELSDEFRGLFAFLVKNLADDFRFNSLFESWEVWQGCSMARWTISRRVVSTLQTRFSDRGSNWSTGPLRVTGLPLALDPFICGREQMSALRFF